MARQIQKFLIVNGRGDMRVVTRRPSLNFDEVAFPLRVKIPESWGRLYKDEIEIAMPEVEDVAAVAESPES